MLAFLAYLVYNIFCSFLEAQPRSLFSPGAGSQNREAEGEKEAAMLRDMSGWYNISLAARLRELRLQVGYSQKNVADLLNVNRSTYTYYETGKTTPDPMTLNRIAKIFGVPLAEFFPEEPTVAMLRDSDEGPKRSPKKTRPDPTRIGELTSSERDVIAFLRDRDLSAADLLDEMRRHFGPGPGSSQKK